MSARASPNLLGPIINEAVPGAQIVKPPRLRETLVERRYRHKYRQMIALGKSAIEMSAHVSCRRVHRTQRVSATLRCIVCISPNEVRSSTIMSALFLHTFSTRSIVTV